jgi:hypothetical protein
MIAVYFAQVERIIEAFPHIRTYELRKKIYNAKQGYVSGQIIFNNEVRLDFIEVKDTDVESKLKYRYHCMDANNETIFRYDNAHHHPESASFPHHKHKGSTIYESIEPSLEDVLLEIAELKRRGDVRTSFGLPSL